MLMAHKRMTILFFIDIKDLEQGRLRQSFQVETAAVVGRKAVLNHRVLMLGRGVAHVLSPLIDRIFRIQLHHPLVAVGFGEDGGGGNRLVGGIALHDATIRDAGFVLEAVAVDQQELRSDRKLLHSAVHGGDGGVEDVQFVNLLFGNEADGVGQRVPLNLRPQFLAHLAGELLGVVDAGIGVVGRQNDSCGHHRTGQTTATCLVAPALYYGIIC